MTEENIDLKRKKKGFRCLSRGIGEIGEIAEAK